MKASDARGIVVVASKIAGGLLKKIVRGEIDEAVSLLHPTIEDLDIFIKKLDKEMILRREIGLPEEADAILPHWSKIVDMKLKIIVSLKMAINKES